MFRALYALVLVVISACQPLVVLATPPVNNKFQGPLNPDEKIRIGMVKKARKMLGKKSMVVGRKRFSPDCSGFISAVLYSQGINVYESEIAKNYKGNGVTLIRKYLELTGDTELETPDIGDLVFFSNTYDKNGDGKLNDELTHIGIIEDIDPDGTLHYLHHSNGRVRRGYANLLAPHIIKDENNKIVNSYLRRRRYKDHSATEYASGELAVGFGSVLPPPDVRYVDESQAKQANLSTP